MISIQTPILFALLFPLLTAQQPETPMPPTPPVAHVANTFRFQLTVPLSQAAPLFGPEGERCWAGKHWDPHFLYPQPLPGQPAREPVRDIQGAVFTVQHGPHTSIWVNTVFDLDAGRMQYVAVISDAVISVIDVRLTPVNTLHTAVEVTYVRTALAAIHNDDVTAMGNSDRDSGPEWQKAIEACLATPPNPTTPSHP
jgi:hypothetical protein